MLIVAATIGAMFIVTGNTEMTPLDPAGDSFEASTWSMYSIAVPQEDLAATTCEIEGADTVEPAEASSSMGSVDGVPYYDLYSVQVFGDQEVSVTCTGGESVALWDAGMGGFAISIGVAVLPPVVLGLVALVMPIWGIIALVRSARGLGRGACGVRSRGDPGGVEPAAGAVIPAVVSGGGDDLDPLEPLEVEVAGGRHRAAQRADEAGVVPSAEIDGPKRICSSGATVPTGTRWPRVSVGWCASLPQRRRGRRLLGAGQGRTDHQAVGAARDRFHQVAAAQAAIGDDVYVAVS